MAEKRKQYKNPPIIEAVCEIRFMPESQWDITVPGLVYGKIKRDFPLKEPHFIQELKFNQDKPNTPPKVENKELAVFLTKDRKTTVKLGIHTPRLIINRVKPYQSWGTFKPNIERAFRSLKNIEGVEIKGIQRIGLRYINILEIAKQPGELQKNFEYRLLWKEELARDIWDFDWKSIVRFNSRDACKIQLASVFPQNPENIG
ncbi:TIGR04255 family protein, partial [candidate division WOR-3 bacterium]|nr:TIGR04255 family protein [candidate division WOR-3 bacterium]